MSQHAEAHLFVAAVRILQHRKQTAPTVEEVSSFLEISEEEGFAVSRRLSKLGIVEVIEDPFATRIAVADYLEIEKLPREAKTEDTIAHELEQFMAKKTDMDKKVEAIQSEIKLKKKAMFNDLEEKLKKSMDGLKK